MRMAIAMTDEMITSDWNSSTKNTATDGDTFYRGYRILIYTINSDKEYEELDCDGAPFFIFFDLNVNSALETAKELIADFKKSDLTIFGVDNLHAAVTDIGIQTNILHDEVLFSKEQDADKSKA